MHKKFRPSSDNIEPWALVMHRVRVLDAAAQIAEVDGDIESLIEISQHVASASDDLVQIYMLLTGDEEEQPNDEPRRPIGFIHESKSGPGPGPLEEDD